MEGSQDSQTIDDYLNKLAVQNGGQTTTNALAKLRAVKLQSYWKRICEDEKRSKQRNAQLLRDLDRMEANMASLDAKREKLKHMKEQYFQYIERTYPKWLELVQQKKREYVQQQEQQQQQQYQQQQQQYQQQQYQQQQQQYHQQQLGRSGGYEAQEGYGETASQQQYKPRVGEKSGTPDRQQTVPKQQEAYHPQHYQDRRHSYQDEDEDSPPPLPSQPPPKVAFSGPEREYTNLRDLRRDSEAQKLVVPSQPASVVQKSAVASQPASVVTVHMPSVGREAPSPSKSSRPGSAKKGEHANQNWVTAERDASVSYSEEIEIRPIQSVTVRQKTEPPKPQGPQGPMMGSLSDDDVSDFGEEPDLPSGAGSVPEGAGVKPESPGRDEVDEEEDTDQTLSTVHPEISTAGLFRLLKFVEEEVMSALAVEGFYRTRSPNEATRKDIIFKANNASSSLKGMDGELVSMVILHQLTLVLRRLPGACMLSDTLLVRRANTLTEAEVRSNLHRDAQELWNRLIEHFITLVRNRVMGTREVAHVFVPCLVHAGSEHQAKAVSVMEAVIESTLFKEDRNTSPVQDSLTVDTARSSQQGGVPPLKFGSLVDSKPFSDEESSIITQSMNTDVQKVPLNETDAYKSLVSGTRPPVRTASHDDTDNSDNELEKQIASTLSPRSMGSKSHNELIREVPYEDSKDESPDLSHEQEPLSEVSSPLAPPVYVPTGTPQSTGKSALGSTGGSSQQRKLAGMLSSDLDSDTEVDIEHMVQKKPQHDDDDDFYDFYG